MEKNLKRKYNFYININKILAFFFILVFITSIVMFFVVVGVDSLSEWIKYFFALSPLFILPLSIFGAIAGLSNFYFKSLKTNIYNELSKKFEQDLIDFKIEELNNYKTWEVYYKQLDLENIRQQTLIKLKDIFVQEQFKSYNEIDSFKKHIDLYKKTINKNLIDAILLDYNNKLIEVLKTNYPNTFKELYYDIEFRMVERIVLSYINGKSTLSENILYGPDDNYPYKPIVIDLDYFLNDRLSYDKYIRTGKDIRKIKISIPNKTQIDKLNAYREFCIDCANTESISYSESISKANYYSSCLDNYLLEDERLKKLQLPSNLNSDKLIKESQAKRTNYISQNFQSYRYRNHCWNCKTPINEDWFKSSVKCSKCGYFKCRNCGRCFCDK